MKKLEIRQLLEDEDTSDIREALDASGIDDYAFDAFVETLYERGISVQLSGDGLTEPVTILPYDEVHSDELYDDDDDDDDDDGEDLDGFSWDEDDDEDEGND